MNAPELHKREEMPELYARGAEGAPWITNVGPQRTRSSDTEAAGDREVRGGLDANRSVFQKRTAERRLQDRRPTAQRESRATLRIKTLRGEPLSLNTVSSDGLFSVNSVSELCVLCGECIGWFRRWIGVCFLFVTFALCSTRAAVPIKVSGLGWMHDREMRVSLAQLTGAKSVEVLDSNSIEDAAVILTSALNEEGFQRPEIDVAATLVDGTERKFRFDPTFTNPVPRPLKAREQLAIRLLAALLGASDELVVRDLGFVHRSSSGSVDSDSPCALRRGRAASFSAGGDLAPAGLRRLVWRPLF